MSIRTHGESQLLFPLLIAAGLLGGAFPARAAEIAGPATMFARNCSGCHSYGKGVKVGPDLKGVTARRDQEWMEEMILRPDVMVKEDETARELLKTHFTPMANQNVDPADLTALMSFLKSKEI